MKKRKVGRPKKIGAPKIEPQPLLRIVGQIHEIESFSIAMKRLGIQELSAYGVAIKLFPPPPVFRELSPDIIKTLVGEEPTEAETKYHSCGGPPPEEPGQDFPFANGMESPQ